MLEFFYLFDRVTAQVGVPLGAVYYTASNDIWSTDNTKSSKTVNQLKDYVYQDMVGTYKKFKPHDVIYQNYMDILTLSQTSLYFTCLQYKSFESSVEKGEIAHDVQFLLFPQSLLPSQITFHCFHQIQNCTSTNSNFGRVQSF